MARLLPVGLLAVLLTPTIAAQLQVPAQRDPTLQMPTERRVPIGTASISGTITATDTGRPVRGARVSVNGTISSGVPRGGGPAALPPGSAPPVRGQGPVSTQFVMTSASRSAITDNFGNFLIENLPAGQYSLNVSGSRNTYLSVSYGQKRPGGPGSSFPIAEGQRAKINIQMMRGGVISGTVFGEDGDPVSNTQIRAWRYTMINGVRRLQSTGYAQTDDRGGYRIFGLQPGDYIVSATPDSNGLTSFSTTDGDQALIAQAIASGAVTPPAAPGMPSTVSIPIRTAQQQMEQRQTDGPPPGYLPVFYPSNLVSSDATAVHVAGGDELARIDIQIRLAQATNVQGTIENPPGEGMGVEIRLTSSSNDAATDSFGARADANGRFTIRNVAPGTYTLLAQVIVMETMTVTRTANSLSSMSGSQPLRQLDDSQKLWGRAVVNVEGQPTLNASITLKPPRTISGRVVFDMERPPDLTRQKVMVSLSQAPSMNMGSFGPPPQAEVGPGGLFTLKGVIPGQYIPRAQVSYAKSVMLNGQDLLDFPLDFAGDRDLNDVVITVTDKYSEVSGTLTDGTGKPATDYMIVAASSDQRYWTPGSRRVVISRPNVDGRYTLRNLPAGEYLIAAVSDLENGAQYDPEFLKSLANATSMHISITEGSRIVQDLRVAR